MSSGNYTDKYDLVIIKLLYRLSIMYPELKENFTMNGVGMFSDTVKLYGISVSNSEKLTVEMKSLEYMMLDKVKRFKYYREVAPKSYSRSDGAPQKIIYYFDLFRKELRNETLDNLLDDE